MESAESVTAWWEWDFQLPGYDTPYRVCVPLPAVVAATPEGIEQARVAAWGAVYAKFPESLHGGQRPVQLGGHEVTDPAQLAALNQSFVRGL